MTFNPTPEEQAQKLRFAELAAAAAIGYYCTPEAIWAAVEAGIADGLETEASLRAARSGELPPAAEDWTPSATPALDRWAAQLNR